ncbi:hypothetical protein SDRG_16204 [Saprolegnia diclina VS20]|uniref:Ion transport domain-containing protein n=1 Tax=Saprolegnia diclina (strain VS20) TaxID=1156394 RepID=T0R8Z6_SAPDV|nr:hypothetical protein SDRG_16204 [Saprolegnia diclina VS20]EQC25947.1 hypothetical protein SDRG_16204 [Saprolegnia diclina VS20]|eukprot:XP_008620627.1 hypothetical protein SDRG_16204 [Saprolegnia diclina VS20]
MWGNRVVSWWRFNRTYGAVPAKSPYQVSSGRRGSIIDDTNDDAAVDATTNSTMVRLLDEDNALLVLQRLRDRSYTPEDLQTAESGDHATVLSKACELGLLDVVTLLLETTPYASIPEYTTRPLQEAASNNRVAILKLLLAKLPEMDVTAKLSVGATALHFAAWGGHDDVLALLLPYFTTVDIEDEDGETPLHVAAKRGQALALKRLLRAGANVNARTKKLETPLHLAVESYDINVVDLLLCANAAVDWKNEDGKTPLEIAQADSIRLLLGREARLRDAYHGHCLARAGDVSRVDHWIGSLLGQHFEHFKWVHIDGSFIDVSVLPDASLQTYIVAGDASDGRPVIGTWRRADNMLELLVRNILYKGIVDLAAGTWEGVSGMTPPLRYTVPTWACAICNKAHVSNHGAPCLSCVEKHGSNDVITAYRQRIQKAAEHVTQALGEPEFDGQTVVMYAAKYGHMNVLRRFLPYCTEPLLQMTDINQQTAMDLLAKGAFTCTTKTVDAHNEALVSVLAELCRIAKTPLDPARLSHVDRQGDARLQCCGSQMGRVDDWLAELAEAKQWEDLKTHFLSIPRSQLLVDDQTPAGRKVWHHVCVQGRLDILGLLLQQPSCNVQLVSPTTNETMLYIAAKHHRVKCVERLLRAGADPEKFHEYLSDASLTWPSAHCKQLITDKQAVKKFHSAFYTANVPNMEAVNELKKAKRSALHAAIVYDQPPRVILALLAQASPQINGADINGDTALMLAARLGHTEAVNCLLNVNAKVNVKNESRETALFLAALGGHVDIVKSLIDRYADMDVVRTDGTTLTKALAMAVLDTKQHEKRNAFLMIQSLLESAVQQRGSPEFRKYLLSQLVLKDTDEAFSKQAFRKAITCAPALGRIFLNDCVELHRHDVSFSQLEHVYGTTADGSALHAILHLQSVNPELLLEAKTECLEHIVMVRMLQIKWELFAERKYIEQLLMNVLLLITMTTSALLFDESSIAANTGPMLLGTFVFVNTIVGYLVVQGLRPPYLYRLARMCYDGRFSLDLSVSIPHLAKYKMKAKWLLASASVCLSLLIVLPVVAMLVFSGLARYYPMSNNFILWLTSLYFVVTELEEMLSSGIANYWKSRINQTQLLVNVVILVVFVPMKLGFLPAPWAVQTGVGGAITIVLWMLSLQFLEVVPAAGYLLPMIAKLLQDVRNFFIFFGVVQMGLTITYYQLFRNQDAEAFNTIGESFVTTYFVAFGQLPLDSLSAFDATDPYDVFLSQCTLVLMMFHSAVVVILLLNVLLAMMNQTVDGGLEKAKTEALTSYAQCILRLEQAMRLTPAETSDLMHLVDASCNKRVLNPIFFEVVSRAHVALRPDHEASIRADNMRKSGWKSIVSPLEAAVPAHVESLESLLRRVNHFSTDASVVAGFTPELRAIDQAKEKLCTLFAKAKKHRGDDMPTQLKALKKSIKSTIRTLRVAVQSRWRPDEPLEPLDGHSRAVYYFQLVHAHNIDVPLKAMADGVAAALEAAIVPAPEADVTEKEDALMSTLRSWMHEVRRDTKAMRNALIMGGAGEARISEASLQQQELMQRLSEALDELHRGKDTSGRRTDSFPVVDPRHREPSESDPFHDPL